nr:CHC2 zinc finger domain-containing protein [Mediterraneibacter faecis]
MVCCPFHSDKSPSMKLDERYYCFGCGATGDAVDLTAKLFGIGLREAAVKLAEDFGLNYDSRQKPSVRPRIREPTPEQKYQKGENHCYKVLTDYFHLLREWEKKYAPKQPDEEWNPLFAEALYKKNYIEYLLDILLYGSLEERKALVAEQRKEVLKLEQRIAELSADRTMHSRRNPKQLRAERER